MFLLWDVPGCHLQLPQNNEYFKQFVLDQSLIKFTVVADSHGTLDLVSLRSSLKFCTVYVLKFKSWLGNRNQWLTYSLWVCPVGVLLEELKSSLPENGHTVVFSLHKKSSDWIFCAFWTDYHLFGVCKCINKFNQRYAQFSTHNGGYVIYLIYT